MIFDTECTVAGVTYKAHPVSKTPLTCSPCAGENNNRLCLKLAQCWSHEHSHSVVWIEQPATHVINNPIYTDGDCE